MSGLINHPEVVAPTLLLAGAAPWLTPDVLLTALSAGVGACWAVVNAETATLPAALKVYGRWCATAAVLSGVGGWLVETKAGVPAGYAQPLAAFLIAIGPHGWRAGLKIIASLRGLKQG